MQTVISNFKSSREGLCGLQASRIINRGNQQADSWQKNISFPQVNTSLLLWPLKMKWSKLSPLWLLHSPSGGRSHLHKQRGTFSTWDVQCPRKKASSRKRSLRACTLSRGWRSIGSEITLLTLGEGAANCPKLNKLDRAPVFLPPFCWTRPQQEHKTDLPT